MAQGKDNGPSGLIVIDKPAGMSSHDVVSKLRWVGGTRRVGHAGTLDPSATGVLVLGVNKATKLLTYMVGQDKTYEATIRLGATTLTEDADGQITGFAPEAAVRALTREAVMKAIRTLTGSIMQVPSAVSAIKVNGVRSYARVRGGEQVQLVPRPVTIVDFDLSAMREGYLPLGDYEIAQGVAVPQQASILELEVRISCSSGTYIRALARDLGQALGVGAHLSALRRTRVGNMTVEDSHSLARLLSLREAAGGPLDNLPLFPLNTAARRMFETRTLTAAQATDVSFGRRISPSGSGSPTPISADAHHANCAGVTAAFAPDGTLVALLENKKFRAEVLASPVLVFEAGTDFTHRITPSAGQDTNQNKTAGQGS